MVLGLINKVIIKKKRFNFLKYSKLIKLKTYFKYIFKNKKCFFLGIQKYKLVVSFWIF